MIIAISSQGMDLNSLVDSRFGRANCFLIYNTNDESFEAIKNDNSAESAHGVGVKTVENLAQKNIDMVISMNFGPQALRALKSAGIKAAMVTEGSVAEAIELARNDKLKLCDKPSVAGH